MRPIEDSISRWERWIECIQRERDGHAVLLADPRSSAIQRAFSKARLLTLEIELADATEKLHALIAQRSHPAMLFGHRPKAMLKVVTLPPRERRRA